MPKNTFSASATAHRSSYNHFAVHDTLHWECTITFTLDLAEVHLGTILCGDQIMLLVSAANQFPPTMRFAHRYLYVRLCSARVTCAMHLVIASKECSAIMVPTHFSWFGGSGGRLLNVLFECPLGGNPLDTFYRSLMKHRPCLILSGSVLCARGLAARCPPRQKVPTLLRGASKDKKSKNLSQIPNSIRSGHTLKGHVPVV